MSRPALRRRVTAIVASAVVLGAVGALVVAAAPASAQVEFYALGQGGGPGADVRPGWSTAYLIPDDGADAYVELRRGGEVVDTCGPGLANEPYDVELDSPTTQTRACSFSSLPGGDYVLAAAQSVGGELQWPTPEAEWGFTVESAPDITVDAEADGTGMVTATSPDDTAARLRVFSPSGSAVCSTDYEAGPWQCDIPAGAFGGVDQTDAYAYLEYEVGTMPSAFSTFDIEFPLPDAPGLAATGPGPGGGRTPGWATIAVDALGGATPTVWVTGPENPACELGGGSCTVYGLEPGTYTAHATQTTASGESPEATEQFRVLQAPSNAQALVDTDGWVRFAAAAPANADRVAFLDADTGDVFCEGAVNGAMYECGTYPSIGEHSVVAYAWNDADGDFGSATSSRVDFLVEQPVGPQRPRVALSFEPAVATAVARVGDGPAWGLELRLFQQDVESEFPPCYRSEASRVSCAWTDLDRGDYVVSAFRDMGEGGYTAPDRRFTVPERAVVTDAADSSEGFAAAGRGTNGDTVIVSAGSTELCRAAVSDGTWRCDAPRASGADAVTALQRDASGGLSAQSASADVRTIDDPTDPPVVPPVVPEDPLQPPGPMAWSFTISGLREDGTVQPGDVVTLHGSELPPGATVSAEIHSRPIVLGTSRVTAGGALDMRVVVPESIEPGDHEFYVVLTPAFGEPSPATQAVTVAPTPEQPVVPEATPAVPRTSASGDLGGAVDPGQLLVPGAGPERNDPANPTILTNSIATLQFLVANPAAFGLAALIAIAILLFVSIPSSMLDSALKNNLGAMGRAANALEQRALALVTWVERRTRTRLAMPLILILVGTILFGFADADIGFDLTTARTELALLAATVLLSVGVPIVTERIAKRRWGIDTWYQSEPLGLIAALAGVALTRFVEFAPGIFIGILFGLEVARSQSSVVNKARLVLVQIGLTFAAALVAWLVYSFGFAGAVPSDFLVGALHDFLVALTTQGLTGLAIALLPLTFLDGHKLIRYRWPLWLACYAIAALGFGMLVMPELIFSQDPIADALPWVIGIVAYAAFAVSVWAVFHRRHGRPTRDASSSADTEPETASVSN